MKKTIKVYKNGKNHLINLPKSILEETELQDCEKLEIENKGKRIVITKGEK